MIDIVDLMFMLAEIAIVTSFLFRDILFLRIATNVGLVAYIAGALFAGLNVAGMKVLIFSNLLGLAINTYQIFQVVSERKPVLLPDELRSVYHHIFQSLTPAEFMKLYRLAEVRQISKGEVLIRQNKLVTELILIKSGEVNVIKNDQVVTQLGANYFVGEMSYLSGDLAKATVDVASEVCEIIVWHNEALFKLEAKNNALFNKLNQVLGSDLMNKINRA